MEADHIGIWAQDVGMAERYYEDVLGLKKEREYDVSADIMKAIFGTEQVCSVKVYGRENVRVEIFDAAGGARSGINHFSLSVGDRKEFCDRAKAKGAEVIKVWRGDHPVYFIKDPHGVLTEIRD